MVEAAWKKPFLVLYRSADDVVREADVESS